MRLKFLKFLNIILSLSLFLSCDSKFKEHKELALKGCKMGASISKYIKSLCFDKDGTKTIYDECVCSKFKSSFCEDTVNEYHSICSRESEEKNEYNACMLKKLSKDKSEEIKNIRKTCVKEKYEEAISLEEKYFNSFGNLEGETICVSNGNHINDHPESTDFVIPFFLKIISYKKTTTEIPGKLKYALGVFEDIEKNTEIRPSKEGEGRMIFKGGEVGEASVQRFLYMLERAKLTNKNLRYSDPSKISRKSQCISYAQKRVKDILSQFKNEEAKWKSGRRSWEYEFEGSYYYCHHDKAQKKVYRIKVDKVWLSKSSFGYVINRSLDYYYYRYNNGEISTSLSTIKPAKGETWAELTNRVHSGRRVGSSHGECYTYFKNYIESSKGKSIEKIDF